MVKNPDEIVWLSDIDNEDAHLVGKKALQFAELVRIDIPVAQGFIIPASMYYQFLKDNNLTVKIANLLRTTYFERNDSVAQIATHIQKLFDQGEFPQHFTRKVFHAYKKISGPLDDAVVRISPEHVLRGMHHYTTALQENAGQHIKGEATLLQKIKQAWAASFTPAHLSERHTKNISFLDAGVSLFIQEVFNEKITGKIYTVHPVNGDKESIIITANDAETTSVLEQHAHEQRFIVDKKTLVTKEQSLGVGTSSLLSDSLLHTLTKYAIRLEQHLYFPQEISWLLHNSNVFITDVKQLTHYNEKPSYLVRGTPIHPGLRSGRAKIIKHAIDLSKVALGDVLVAHETDGNYENAMKKASAIVTEKGGHTSHAAMFSRRHGIPTVIGANNATKLLKQDRAITVNAITGEIRMSGTATVEQSAPKTEHEKFTKTATRLYVSVSNVAALKKEHFENIHGYMVLNSNEFAKRIGLHPKKMIQDKTTDIYIQKLAHFLETLCQSVHPKQVLYKFSDLTSSEYAQLQGGKENEAAESNPLLGYHGALRMLHESQLFSLEVEAIKIVRQKRGYENLSFLLPFIRTAHELTQIKDYLAKHSLERSPTLPTWIMVQTPANVISLYQYVHDGIDGIFIDVPSITSLLMGIDEHNPETLHYFDHSNEAITWSIEHIAKVTQKYGIPAVIGGNTSSLHPTIIEHAVKKGIIGIVTTEHALPTAKEYLAQFEQHLLV